MKPTIAFLWVGPEISIPSALVTSIRFVMSHDVEIVQLTDKKTPLVPGCNRTQRFALSKNIMVARLQAYSKYRYTSGLTFFCDADSLFIKPLVVDASNKNLLLTPRLHDFPINDRFPEYYPEFTGKMISQVMPYLFGAIATYGNQSKTFCDLLKICKSLPDRFHRWYGDQYSLFVAINNKLLDFGHLNPAKHLHITKDILTSDQLQNLQKEDIQMVTFKGPQSKQYLFSTLENLKSL